MNGKNGFSTVSICTAYVLSTSIIKLWVRINHLTIRLHTDRTELVALAQKVTK